MSSYAPKAIIALMLGAGVALAGQVFADGLPGHGGCGHRFHTGMAHAFGYSEARIEHMAKRLDLSDKQLASLRGIVDRNRPQLRKALDEMAESHKQIRGFVKAGKVDSAGLKAAADLQGKAVAQMIVVRVKMKEEIGRLLTDEQRKKMRRMKMHATHPAGRGWGAHAY